ncbi:hypothetical protein MBLNU459_g6675t1 [Dothideomycetes sp. NU459]
MSNELHSEDLGLDLGNEQVLDVLDLPQIHTKPSARSLLDTLSLLSLEPRSWDRTPSLTPATSNTPRSTSGATTPARRSKPRVRSEGVSQYLTRIISSRLAWIEDDGQKEEVWDAASIRLSERSGRTGMGAMTRSFAIPICVEPTDDKGALDTAIGASIDQDTAVDVEIHEPALTEDNLGLKTWASSYVFARKWHTLKDELPFAFDQDKDAVTILELGAGTGLVGIAAAAVLHANVLLTDLPEIVPNLVRNIDSNTDIIATSHGSAKAAILDWTDPGKIVHYQGNLNDHGPSKMVESAGSTFPLIVAADPIYTKDHPRWLVETISVHLARRNEARVIIMIPIRDAYADERADLKSRMQGLGLHVCKEEIDVGYDDWSEGRGEELKEVECWMTIWKWNDS